MRNTNLTYDRLKEVLTYNPSTGKFIWKELRNGGAANGDVAGSLHPDGYIYIGIDGKVYLAHRLVWLYVNGYFPEYEIDHINRIRNDNRIKNLRHVSRQCNKRNCGNRYNNKSGVKGIYWNIGAKKWQGYIAVNYKQKNLGYYTDFDEAVFARYAAEQCLNWKNCDSSSPARQYLLNRNLILK